MTDILDVGAQNPDVTRDERAQKAVKAFRALQPTLTAYARVYTGNKRVRVEVSNQNAHTDGDRIYYRPPMELGDLTPHVRKLCDKRDEIGKMRCPACAIRESVLIAIYHEIAHITEGTFDKPDEYAFKEATERAIKEHGTKYASEIRKRLEGSQSRYRVSYLSLSNIISPFMPLIVNALEDARVNRNMFEARRGTKAMWKAFISDIFSKGVEQVDPVTGEMIIKHWRDYPLNTQMITAIFCKAAGDSGDDWFAPVVAEALADDKLSALIEKNLECKNAGETYELAFPILARLRELGFCKAENDPEDEEPQPEEEQDGQPDESNGEPDDVPQPDQDDAEEGEGSSNSSGDGSSDSETGEGSPDSERAGSSSGPDSDDANEREDDSDGGSSQSDPDGNSQAGKDLHDELSGDDKPEDGPEGDGREDGDAQEDSSDGDADSDDGSETGKESMGDSDGSDAGDNGASEGEGVDDEVAEGDGEDGSESPEGDGGKDAEHDSTGDVGDSDEGQGDVGEDPQDVSGEDSTSGDKGQERGDPRTPDQSSGAGGGQDGSDVGDSSSAPIDKSDSAGDDGEGLDGTQDVPQQVADERDRLPDQLGTESGASRDEVDRTDSDVRESESPVDNSNPEGGDQEPPTGEADAEAEPVDTGADKGRGGTKLTIPEGLEMGDADDVKGDLNAVMGHQDPPETAEARRDDKAIDVAVIQGMYFESPSVNVASVRMNYWGKGSEGRDNAWDHYADEDAVYNMKRGVTGEFDPDESIMGPALLKMRRVFADNRRSKKVNNLKSGKINARVLGKRAPISDPRLFRHASLPGKKDYSVVIGMDVSGSTAGVNIGLEKRAVMAQANLLARMGVDFAIVAHSALSAPGDWLGTEKGAQLDIYMVKEFHEPWSEPVKNRLRTIGPYSGNLDGHALEFMRKLVERTTTTDKVIMYYSDGKMPAMNHDEELDILQREIKYCRRHGISLLGVGIRTDSPSRHGLDTVEVEVDRDITKVVQHLEKHLL